jgi:hypothetical protein
LTVEPVLEVLNIDCRSVLLLLLLEDACSKALSRLMATFVAFVAEVVDWFCRALSIDDAAVLKAEMELCANCVPWARCCLTVDQAERPKLKRMGTRWNPDIAIASGAVR